ncbi:MAG: hypothetical protein KC800_33780 [Candidatus Eremiobacteraeota bacterium]|nr:hypothetical protein [Candidatus Eremiobacteraeota bacterium]
MENRNAANPGTITTLNIRLTQIVSSVKIEKSTCSDMLPQGALQQIR